MLVHPMVAHGYPAKVTRWEPTIRAACRFYRLDRWDTHWAVEKGLGIIDLESGVSPTAIANISRGATWADVR
jgi:hypothetical protein